MDKDQVNIVSTTVANMLLMLIIIGFIMSGIRHKVNVYDAFIEGAKDGFQTAIRIIPYLVAILVGIGVFRASGAMDMLIDGVKWTVAAVGLSRALRESRSHGYPRLRLRSGRERRLYGVCGQALL